MDFEKAYKELIDSHIQRRAGERRARLLREISTYDSNGVWADRLQPR